MRDAPSRTARKVAINVVMLGADPNVADVLPEGSAEATERLSLAAGVVTAPVDHPATARAKARADPREGEGRRAPRRHPVHDRVAIGLLR